VVAQLAEQQAARGHVVGVAAGPGELWAEVGGAVRVFSPSAPQIAGRRGLLMLRRVISTEDWDIVHTHQRGVSVLAGLARRGHTVRHVEHVHNVFLPVTHKRLSFRGDLLIACGTAVADMLVNDYGRSPSRVRNIPNGTFDHGVRTARSGSSAGDFRLLNIARVAEQKNPRLFVEAVAALRGRGVEASGTWIGDGDLLEDMRALVERLGLREHVHFPGPVRPAVQHLADADAFLLTSRWEGLPLALIEATAAGLPVVAPRVGSVGDVVVHGETGWLYDPSDSAERVGSQLAELVESGQLAGMGRNGRLRYEQDFTFDRVVDQVVHEYEELLDRA
jgi:glycosyltransferase involved in cell wall biosynthesis